MQKRKNILIIISVIILLGILSGFIVFKIINKEEKNKEKYNESNYFDEYIDKINAFNEVFSEVDFDSISADEEESLESRRCTTLEEELAKEYFNKLEGLYKENRSSFIEVYELPIDRKHKDMKTYIDLCKPLNCDITPISKDLYHYKEEDGKKYLDIGEEGNIVTYELVEKDGKLISIMPIVYCPYYSNVE